MAGLVVVDTDLIIDFLRGSGQGVAMVRDLLVDRRLRMTAVTAFELRLGTDFLRRGHEIPRLLTGRTIPMDLASALMAAEVYSDLKASGRQIGMADCLTAGTCIRHNMPLATRNNAHFNRVDTLELLPMP